MTAFRAALLDLDGTLLDSIPDLAWAANAMRVELGMALREDVVATFVGKGVDNLVRRSLAGSLEAAEPDADAFAHAREIFHRHYHEVNGEKATVYPGVIEGLKHLREQAETGGGDQQAHRVHHSLLQRAGLAGFFDAVVCGDTCARRKPDPDQVLHACELLGVAPREAVTIGDSINDAQAGRNAGTQVLVVPYGYNEGRDVRELDVDGIVDTLVDAARWVALWNQNRDAAEIHHGIAGPQA